MGPRALGAEAAAQVSAGRVRPGVISEQERAQGYEQSRIVYAPAPALEHLRRDNTMITTNTATVSAKCYNTCPRTGTMARIGSSVSGAEA
jgi:hypothetical protein